jgi:BirA family biotin operon repressor/biotin-[acetyl-CoA-carboxylase] ligase
MMSTAESPLAQSVFAALADGRFHSGESLASARQVTRSAVWKAIESLRELGVEIEAATHRGYRLAQPTEALDAVAILGALPDRARDRVAALDVAWSLESTNATLLARPPPAPGRVQVLLAEHQSAGRGRRGRSWLAPVGGALCLSVGTVFETLPRELPALTLTIGVCLLRALRPLGAESLGLKWPNDLVADGRKLGGILIELRAEAGGPGHVVIGAGLNLRLPEAALAAVSAAGTAATDLATLGVAVGGRNRLAGLVLGECILGVQQFEREGFRPFIDEWRAADALRDRPVRVLGGAADTAGIARGIDAFGALQLELPDGRLTPVISGEVSVRPEHAA